MRSSVRNAVRNTALAVVLGTLRVSLRLLSRVVPQSRSIVLAAYPETEGNAVEVARALLARYPGRIVWLRGEGPAPSDVLGLAQQGMVLVKKASLGGIWAYLRAQAVFFTHGLYGSPRPCPKKPVVNLWHGDGPKDVRPDKGVGAFIASTYLVGSTRLFTGHQASAFDIPAERVLLAGNPRTDQFWQPLDRDRLIELGITADFVLWMPTFRRPRAVGAVRVHDDTGATGNAGGTELEVLLDGLRARGLQLVVKPHPMDADRRRFEGMVTVEEEDLVGAGVSLYGLLGASAGLVTDYSSAWVDYLLLDRPIAFLVPDRSSYDRTLLPADVLDWAPGEVVSRDRPFQAFLQDLDTGGRVGAAVRHQVAERIGLSASPTAAEDLVAALVERRVLTSR
jgi:CDP-glycerol glycerophosphotransferase